MVNILSDAAGILDVARNVRASRKNVNRIKQLNYQRLKASGRFAVKPMNLNPPSLSSNARNRIKTFQNASTGFLEAFIDTNASYGEGMATLAYQNQIDKLVASIDSKEDSSVLNSLPESGSLFDAET